MYNPKLAFAIISALVKIEHSIASGGRPLLQRSTAVITNLALSVSRGKPTWFKFQLCIKLFYFIAYCRVPLLRDAKFVNRVKRELVEIIFTKQHWWDALSFFTIHINLHMLCIQLHVEIQWLMNSLRKITCRFCSERFHIYKEFRDCLVFHSQANLCTRSLSMHRDISISGQSVNWSGYL